MKKLLVLTAALALAATGVANAGTVNVSNFTGPNVTIQSNFATGTYVAGSVTVSNVQGLSPLADFSSFVSFCIDLQHTVSLPEVAQNTTLDLMSNWDGYGAFTPQVNAGRYAAYLYNTYSAGLSNNDQRAGLQLAIWNVLYDNDFSVTTAGTNAPHTFVATAPAAAITAANSYLTGLSANLATAANSDAYWLRLFDGTDPNNAPQDFIGPAVVPDGGATLSLLGAALLGLGALRRKFNA